MAFLKAEDAISGKEGKCTAVIDGNVVELIEIMNYTATLNKTKNSFRALGHRGTQSKAAGWEGTGSFTARYVNSLFIKMLIDYAKTGKDFYFDMIVVNEDPSSATGKQTIQLGDCNLDGGDIAKLDIEADFLDHQFNFTFSEVDILDEFNKLV